jgi:hypothetical protein
LALGLILTFVAANLPAIAEEDTFIAGEAAATVLPPTAKSNGNSYPEWSAFWWRHFLHIPKAKSVVNKCSVGQVGSVWFLVGTGNITHCTIPFGKVLVISGLSAECSNLEPAPFFGATEAARRACAKKILDGATNVTASVDGKPITNIKTFRFSSPNFTFVFPPKNVYDPQPPGFGEAVADGYFVIVPPPTKGKHTIRMMGSLPAFNYNIDRTFDLLIK